MNYFVKFHILIKMYMFKNNYAFYFRLLHKYFTQQRNKSIFPICATYLLAGRLQDGSLRVTIVNAADKESEASKFTEITSEHIYSVQKGISLKDIKVLCGIGKEVNQIKK